MNEAFAVVAIVLFAGAGAVVLGSPLTARVLRATGDPSRIGSRGTESHRLERLPARVTPSSTAGAPGIPQPDVEVLTGGRWIGLLERCGAFAAVLAGSPEALAMVLAVKGLGRYPELRNAQSPAVAERFIIGTFSSVLWACAWAGIARFCLWWVT